MIWYADVMSYFRKEVLRRNIIHRYFNFLFELPSLNMPWIYFYFYQFTATLLSKGLVWRSIMKSINTSTTYLLRRDLARVRKFKLMFYNKYIIAYSLQVKTYLKLSLQISCYYQRSSIVLVYLVFQLWTSCKW